MESQVIATQVPVQVSTAHARRWFLELEAHPERYQFETHAGFAFTRGNFGQAGARFQTRERFCGLRLTLGFELTEVNDARFRFRLIRPPLPVWGAFAIEEAGAGATDLRLAIGGTTRLGAGLLRLPLVRGAIRQQIRGEVEHIKISMETTGSLPTLPAAAQSRDGSQSTA
jgi:hypothetical protein